MTTRRIIVCIVLLIAGCGLLFYGQYRLSLRKLTVNFSHISVVEVYKQQVGVSGKPYKKVTSSGSLVSLPKGNYILNFVGEQDYATSTQTVLIQKDQSITVKPNYSQQKLSQLLIDEGPAVQNLLSSKYSSMIYKPDPGYLYQDGTWYGTKLIYQGDDDFNADTLKVIMHKKSGVWTIVTNPPNIVFNKYDYPNIPRDVLDMVNAIPVSRLE